MRPKAQRSVMEKVTGRFLLPLQDYESIVKLVETLEKLPTFDPMANPHVKFHYAFALNR